MPTPGEIFLQFVLPALLVGVALLIGWWKTRNGRWIGAIAISGGFALSACGIGGLPHWPPGSGDASFWLVWFAIPVGLLGLLDALFRPPIYLRVILVFLLLRIESGEILAAMLSRPVSSGGVSPLWLYCFATFGTVIWLLLETLAARASGMTLGVTLTFLFAFAGAILGISDNVKASKEAVAIMGMSIAATVLARPLKICFDRSILLAVLVPLLGILVFVNFYSYTPPPIGSVILLLIAPISAWCGDLPGIKKWRPGKRLALRLIAVGLSLAAAFAVTAHDVLQPSRSADKQSTMQGDD